MAQKKDLLAKVFGTRLSNRLRGTNAKQNGSQHNKYHSQDPDEEAEAELRRPSTAPSRDAPRKSSYKKNPPPPIQTRFDRDEVVVGLAMSSDSSDHEQEEANSDGGQPRSRRRRQQKPQQQQEELQRPRTAPNGSSASSSSRHITIASPPPVPSLSVTADLSPRRLSRRTSLKQRFWSANPSNSFLELDPASPSFPKGNGGASASRARSVYMPRHAATDFSKTALARRTSVHARASERIARRFSSSEDNDDDAKTLCSINCREEQDPEQITRDLDLWLATLRRQQAAMKTAPANSSSPSAGASTSACASGSVSAEEQLQVQQHVVQQAKFLQCPPPPSPLSPNGTFTSCCTTGTSPGSNYSHAAATESESDDEYGVFSQLQAETQSKSKSKAQARAALRCSTIITTAPPPDTEYAGGDLFGSAPSPMLDDPILHRSSTYGKNPMPLPPSPSPRRSNTTARPKSLTASKSPRMSTFAGGARPPVPIVTPGAGVGPIMTDYLEPSARPRSSIVRTTTNETRRTSCAKTPAVTTVVEAS